LCPCGNYSAAPLPASSSEGERCQHGYLPHEDCDDCQHVRVFVAASSSEGVETRAEPFDLAAWNQSRLDACRITGTTYEQQENAISRGALAYAQSVDERPESQS
jgi:hypothetical protein